MKNALLKSIILHIAVIILLLLDIPYWGGKKMTIEQVPIIIDLKDVKISEMTNLPELAKRAKETKKATKEKEKVKENYSKKREEAKPAPEPKPKPKAKPEVKEKPKTALVEEVKKKESPKPKDEVKSKPKPNPKPKEEPKPKEVKKVEVKPVTKKEVPELANPLKSLLASVEKIEKDIKPKEQEATIAEDEKVNNMGVKGGTGGSYFTDLTISEADMIAGRLRGCWNIDPGARGIEDMIIEIRTHLNKDGTVSEVEILDKSRYNSDPHFKSVAESARRAVYICAPYTIFAEKYSENYDVWKTILMRFNPLDGNVS